MIGNARLHDWRNSQTLMDASEVVAHEIERRCMTVILDLLAVWIGQSGEPPHSHPNLQVHPLRIAG